MDVQGMMETDVTHLSRMSNGHLGKYRIERSPVSGKVKFSLIPRDLSFDSPTAPFLVLEGEGKVIANLLDLMAQAIRAALEESRAQVIENAGRHD